MLTPAIQHVGLILICFLFCSLYSAIPENFPYYSPQHVNYSPIILMQYVRNPHLLVRNENSHIHKAVS